MGFNVSIPNLGFIDFMHPIDFLSGGSQPNKDYAGGETKA
jgi:hypothetical protein